ncbi:MAG: tRNA lysidine(34) synthetase TilS [Planctomycetota bacterium]
MQPIPVRYPWPTQWARLAHGLGLHPATPVAVALSGGADSVFLTHLVQRAVPRPKVMAIHVDHGLRGEESHEDAAFCARLCARLGVPFARKRLDVEDGPDLEARLRKARYAALLEETGSAGIDVLLTGHHEDDALETLLMRMMRGGELGGLTGPARETLLGRADGRKVRVLRPLLHMRREEVRALLRGEGLEWREDSSNTSLRHTRNRVREQLLPAFADTCGPEGLENLRRFAGAVDGLESELAARTAHLGWEAPDGARAMGSAPQDLGAGRLGGTLPRRALTDLAPPLQRRALVRLLVEGTGQAPSREVLDRVQQDLVGGRAARTTLAGRWTLEVGAERLSLAPPSGAGLAGSAEGGTAVATAPAVLRGTGLQLGVPGTVRLPDGRTLSAALVDLPAGTDVPRDGSEVHLDATDGPRLLTVRNPQPGDRFHALGAPGKRPLVRFLADAGVPAAERPLVPLVFLGEELVWVAGQRPAESRRVQPRTTRRLVLRLEDATI